MSNKTELVFILDKSGSMGGLESDTIGGYNTMLEKQKKVDGTCTVTTVLFNQSNQILHDRIDIRAIEPLTEKDYTVGGGTALLDAIGTTIHKISAVQKHTAKDYRADNVLFVIITDGMENSSCEYSPHRIRKMIKERQEKYGWEFIFLGANIDAEETAEGFGIKADHAADYQGDSVGTKLNYEVMSDTVASFRETGSLDVKTLDRIRSYKGKVEK
ncbi:MAG: VWA domain-containing protein [Acidaminococcus sp.]|jgi:uncharacterized protein YegL|nr:VWA domain-containing protein [Acidaminococcus sp.]MCI2114404.1 VWA domain-containing protein [Acidaminococcus sp.]MCI2116206.1 VWA domain-containing protein [Acidaminococcus sp.]